jgi:hypothetical protein
MEERERKKEKIRLVFLRNSTVRKLGSLNPQTVPITDHPSLIVFEPLQMRYGSQSLLRVSVASVTVS